MGTISGTLGAPSKGWFKALAKASAASGLIAFPITGPENASEPTGRSMLGVILLNKASVVGQGGTGITITADSSTVVVTE